MTHLTTACYTFPHYHRSTFNDRVYASGWTEYELVRGSRPWFEGHHQPRTPLLGELDERQPATWEVYNRLASQAGIDVFIFDWYWYEGEPVFHEALEDGFLQTHDSMDFAVMWTNHAWYRMFPTRDLPRLDPPVNEWFETFGIPPGQGGRELLALPPTRKEEIWRCLTYLIARYFHHPRYWRINDCPVLVIWDIQPLLTTFGIAGTQTFLDELRAFAQKLGHPGIYIHASHAVHSEYTHLAAAGFDSYGIYSPIAEGAQRRGQEEILPRYDDVVQEVIEHVWPELDDVTPLPFFPGIGPGWDNAPRSLPPQGSEAANRAQWPGVEIVVDESPAAFARLAQAGRTFLKEHPTYPQVLTIGCWNEWTEGQYLLPDTKHGYGMLRALASALAEK